MVDAPTSKNSRLAGSRRHGRGDSSTSKSHARHLSQLLTGPTVTFYSGQEEPSLDYASADSYHPRSRPPVIQSNTESANYQRHNDGQDDVERSSESYNITAPPWSNSSVQNAYEYSYVTAEEEAEEEDEDEDELQERFEGMSVDQAGLATEPRLQSNQSNEQRPHQVRSRISQGFGSISGPQPFKPEEPSFEVIHQPSRFFKPGRVFKCMWSEPAGNTAEDRFTSYRGGHATYTKIRRFVVVKQKTHNCICIPLQTYGGRGISKSGIQISEHAMVYEARADRPPRASSRSIKPFPIVLETPGKIDPSSVLHFGSVYTVEYNVKVAKIGRIEKDHVERLKECWQQSMGFQSSSVVYTASASDDRNFSSSYVDRAFYDDDEDA
ncbi:hypothetical protein PVAG01_07560 [Phlyctema vagabunda]|uniref:DUF6590 domain-containing protein n=1 Tax=Phlyctema vagabunda TaxID=108571 RepID=A0ABR4PCW3_9HELO